MTAERSDLQNAFETALTAEMGPSDLTATVSSIGVLTSPCILVIEPDSDTQREFIRFDGTFGGSSFVATAIGKRYLEGSAQGSGLTHPIGSVVASIATKDHFHDLHDRVDDADTDIASVVGDLVITDAAFAAHDGGTDVTDHPEATASVRGFMSAADKDKLDDGGTFLHEEVDNGAIFNLVSIGGGSYVTCESLSLAIPTHWGSWKCEAHGTFVVDSSEADDVVTVVIDIDGVSQPAMIFNTLVASNDMPAAAAGRRTGMTTTGSRTVLLKAKGAGAGFTVVTDGFFYARAVRTS